jgi:hypothetical protein
MKHIFYKTEGRPQVFDLYLEHNQPGDVCIKVDDRHYLPIDALLSHERIGDIYRVAQEADRAQADANSIIARKERARMDRVREAEVSRYGRVLTEAERRTGQIGVTRGGD